MRAPGLTLVLILAKILVLAGREVTWSWWAIPAYFWHDVAVGAAFGLFEILVRRPAVISTAYYAVVAYAALNVAVARALSSPLTVPMWRAAGGPLLDSIAYYLTFANIGAMALVVGIAVVLGLKHGGHGGARRTRGQDSKPFSPRDKSLHVGLVAAAFAVIFIVLGLIGGRRVATLGLERNAVTALLTTLTPRMSARTGHADWRTSPFAERTSSDLAAIRGAAAGMNVVLVILESTGAQYLAPYGASDDPMPNLSVLARRSVLFEHAYAVYPESIKGLFATLCARPPAFDVDAETHAASPCTPLPQVLAGAGYRTALFHSGRFTYLGMEAILGQQRFDTTADAGAIGGNIRSSFGVEEPATVQYMLSWIDKLRAGENFFLAYLPAAGHHPYASPVAGPFPGTTELDAYKNALHYADASLGALFDGLRQRGLDRRTMVVLVGDHGEAFGQHDGNVGHSLFIFEENLRVPLLFALPADSKSGAESVRVARPASVIDVAPTVLDLLGIESKPLQDGVSLLRPRERMVMFFTDYSLGWLGLRDGCWKFIFEVEARRGRLYDLCQDPGERTDRSTQEPERVDVYRERLEQWARARRAQVTSPSSGAAR